MATMIFTSPFSYSFPEEYILIRSTYFLLPPLLFLNYISTKPKRNVHRY